MLEYKITKPFLGKNLEKVLSLAEEEFWGQRSYSLFHFID
jgi:hypothetical protein